MAQHERGSSRLPMNMRAGSPERGRSGQIAASSRGERGESLAAQRMGVIRIVIVSTGEDPLGGPPPMSVETTAGLARLGDPVELLRAEVAEEVRDLAADPSVDLVLFDRLETAEMLAAIPGDGPPSVVVIDGDSEAEALDAFRAGASDCVHFGPEYEHVLPVVLLEQIQRWRNERQRQLSEDRIRWLEDLYAAIVSEMPAGLVVIDRDGLIVAENPEFGRLFPSRSALAGEASEFLAARLPAELSLAFERAERTESERGSHFLELVRVDDPEAASRAYELRHRRLPDAERVLLVISDVTESEWLSERLEALRRDTRDIIENINSALIVVDLGGRISFANPAADLILGGRDGDLVGRQVEDWFAPAGEDVSPIEACLESGVRSRGAETFLQRGDGQWIPVGISCSPRLDASGRSQGVVAVFQDLSEIKELELQVRQTEKMASIGQLAAGVAHEVNNPMGFIHANLHQMSEYLGDLEKYFEATQSLQRAAIEGDLEVVRTAAEDVAAIAREIDLDFVRSDFEKALLESGEGAERIRHIVKDLRDFSRPDLPVRTPADVNQAIDSTANIVYTMMKHRVELEKDYHALPEIEAYPMQLKQVFMNLLVNAHQAIEARGESEPGVIRIETDVVGEEIVIRISDTGIGISERDRARIFEPFFTTKPLGAGTGLGLSTSFNIIERHGGRIVVESEVGRGTLFEIWLPTSPPEAGGSPSVLDPTET
ncbi:MAG: PAS domain S-box protein [bacterium]|nr:PAS domain S-box protein [bacterium]